MEVFAESVFDIHYHLLFDVDVVTQTLKE